MLITGLFILLIVSASKNVSLTYKHISRLVILVLIFSIFLTFITLNIAISGGISLYNNLFHVSLLTQTFDIIILILGIIVLLLSSSNYYNIKEYKKNNTGQYIRLIEIKEKLKNKINTTLYSTMGEYSIICLFSLIGSSLLMTSNDLITLFIAVELQSYSLYILATINKNSYAATKQGLTYFLLGSLASILILLGSALIYILTGLTNIEDISIIYSYEYYNNILQLALVIILVGLLFKIGSAPFHNWQPDVYDGVPTIVTTWLSTITKISLLLVIYEFVHNLWSDNLPFSDYSLILTNITELNYNWTNIVIIGSLLSILVGSISGYYYSTPNLDGRLKKLLAYSGITNVGYLLLAIVSNSYDSLISFIIYLIQYSLTNINIFFVIILLGYILYMYNNISDKYSPIQYLYQLNGFMMYNPYLIISMVISLFSLIGIPPLLGFYSKYLVILGSLNSGFYLLTLILILGSAISTYYYLVIIQHLITIGSSPISLISNNLDPINSNNLSISNIQNEVDFNDKNIILTSNNWFSFTTSVSYIISVITLILIFFFINPKFILQGAQIVAMTEFFI